MAKEYKRITTHQDCTGCLACEVACKQEHNLPVGPRWIRIYPDIREIGDELKLSYYVTECHRAATPQCQSECPAEMDAWKYVILTLNGKYQEALDVVREITPFAGVLGRVCTRACETSCYRSSIDVPVAIRSIKAFLADEELRQGRKKAEARITKSDKVAVIGSGPAGLSAAYDLAKLGYPVTVFEARPEAGGLMRYGIPEFRLPQEALDNEIDYIKEIGVAIKTDSPVKDPEDLFQQGYKAVFLGIGAGLSQKMNIPGENTPGVLQALDFLRQVRTGETTSAGDRVAVIGGGNAAVDTARTALKLGAKKVTIVYRRSRNEMPAMLTEIEEAEGEGVDIQVLAQPVSIIARNNEVTGIQCVKNELGEVDASGRRAPVAIKDSEFTMDVDRVIIAVGQGVDKAAISDELEYNESGALQVDPITFRTNIEGVFAGGDAVTGPADIINAVAVGREAAVSIDRYVRGVDLKEDRKLINYRYINGAPIELDPRSRTVNITNEKEAYAEAIRCFNCGVCAAGLEIDKQPACVAMCPSHCMYYGNYFEQTPKTGTLTVK